MYDYGLLKFKVVLKSNKTGSIIITRTASKNIRTAKVSMLKRFSNMSIVEISFIEYVRK